MHLLVCYLNKLQNALCNDKDHSKSPSWCESYLCKYLVFENPIHTLIYYFCNVFILCIFSPLSSPFYTYVHYSPLSVMPITFIALKFIFQGCLKHIITFALCSVVSEVCHCESDRHHYVPLVIVLSSYSSQLTIR